MARPVTVDPTLAAQLAASGKDSKASNPFSPIAEPVRSATDAFGITNPAPPDLSQGPDAQATRDFAAKLRGQYGNLQPGQARMVRPDTVTATSLDQTQANQARDAANRNLAGLEGVANGAPTAADALLQRGTDTAARQAMGTAAAYSRGNPAGALRAGLAAGNDAAARAASVAAEQKANEQAQARGQIGSFADAMRGADLNAAQYNANAANQTGQFNATTNLQGQKANQDALLQQQQINNQHQVALGNLASTSSIAPLNAAQANAALQQQNQANNQHGIGALITAAGALSDERAKKDIKPAPSFADALGKGVHGVTFAYKPGHDDGGKHVGVLAQEVEKTVPGAVTEGRDGFKRVDVGHMTMANTAATAELARRLRALEGKKDDDVKWGPYPYARESDGKRSATP